MNRYDKQALFVALVIVAAISLPWLWAYTKGHSDGRKSECERLHPEAHSCVYIEDGGYTPLYRDEPRD